MLKATELSILVLNFLTSKPDLCFWTQRLMSSSRINHFPSEMKLWPYSHEKTTLIIHPIFNDLSW